MLTATDRLEVDKYLFSFCVYASCCCLFVFRDEVVRWFRKLVETRELVTEIVFVMGGFSSYFSIRENSSRQLLSILRLTTVRKHFFATYFYVGRHELFIFC